MQEDLGLDEYEGHVQFSYYLSTSILVVVCGESPVHETMIELLTDCLRPKLAANVRAATGRSFYMLSGQDAGLKKKPDLSIIERNPGNKEQIKWALEIGFSETYDDLLEDARSWLTGRSGDAVYCALVKITEDPKFTCPLRGISDEDVQRRGLKDAETIEEQDFTGEEYGPVFYDGDRWAGNIREVFWEVWRRHPGTGKPELVGKRERVLPKSDSSPTIQLDQFLSSAPPGAQACPDWDRFRALLQHDIKAMALERYQDWYYKRGRAEGDDPRVDRDYE